MTDVRTPAPDPMTGAALRCTRERLGLTTRWLADHLDVNERSLHRWEAGVRRVPRGVCAEIERLQTCHDELVQRLDGALSAMSEPRLVTWRTDADVSSAGGPEAGYPASWHRAAVAQVLVHRPGTRVAYRDGEDGERSADGDGDGG
ncbi:transcriptional regulator [Xylanimonas allomyrinae]|uniref:Transcriptional regulator n=1 Tax=Xylanimonas allomyrinae TaxID=2509459 RepID=A0A4P6EMC6_9MICO|nr:helix-turn-helix domain-containing protein [Xylanimonas allomyrinae]QAY63864.1 transcriptional regulator [Xylanimonas allomyrinae]